MLPLVLIVLGALAALTVSAERCRPWTALLAAAAAPAGYALASCFC